MQYKLTMKTVFFLFGLLVANISFGQPVTKVLDAALKKLAHDEQIKHATISLYVVDTKSGIPIYDINSQAGLAPASCQKLITSVAAFEILGKDFHYYTYIGLDLSGPDKTIGSLFIIGRGDPTLGSWRWKSTADTMVFSKITAVLFKNHISSFGQPLYVDDIFYGLQPVPDGWIWQDIGNYYGAACYGFNWHENQYDLVLQPGEQEGDATLLVKTLPRVPGLIFQNTISTGARGSGDNGYIYASPFSSIAITVGTIPLQKGQFTITGSLPDPAVVFKAGLIEYLQSQKISIIDSSYSFINNRINNKPVSGPTRYIDSIASPSLDSINYWFLKKSVNLYGEAFLKAMAVQKYPFIKREQIYDSALAIIKNFWKERGIESSALNISDGSGLSPANRVTTNALVTVLQYARSQEWFPSFYNALPELNGIKMKDGYINGVRSFTGYVKSKSGKEYTFSFIINNFSGSAGMVREKMWKILDILK